MELELVAVVGGMQKYRLYVLDLLTFVFFSTNHIPVLNAYTLDAVQDANLQRKLLRERQRTFYPKWTLTISYGRARQTGL